MDYKDIGKILVSEKEIGEITSRLAKAISRDYESSKNFVLLGLLKGSVVFMSELMKKITIPAEIEFMKVSSYNGMHSTRQLHIHLDVKREDLSNCDILVIEDIIDSGHTLKKVTEHLKSKGAKSVRTCTLLDKPSRREVEMVPDYVGTEIPDEFVIGFGLDYNEKYRTLPFIGVLKPEVYGG